MARVSDLALLSTAAAGKGATTAWVMPTAQADAFLVGKADLAPPLVLPGDPFDPIDLAPGDLPGCRPATPDQMANLVDAGEPAWRPMDDDAWLGRPGEDLWQ